MATRSREEHGRVAGKVVFISGAASGMGACHARTLFEEGAAVVIADVNEDLGLALCEELGDQRAMFTRLDVTDFSAWEQAIQLTVERFGHLDALVNNAGISSRGSVEEEEMASWHRTIDVDLHGVFYGMKAAVPELKKVRASSIVNISSIAGVTGFKGRAAYSTAKWAVHGLTKTSAMDLAEYGIRVNSVHPGSIATPMTAQLKRGIGQIPLARVGRPPEVSSIVVHLVSDESSFTTGGTFLVDGGETAGNNLRGLL